LLQQTIDVGFILVETSLELTLALLHGRKLTLDLGNVALSLEAAGVELRDGSAVGCEFAIPSSDLSRELGEACLMGGE
jgi:hypothetical protein